MAQQKDDLKSFELIEILTVVTGRRLNTKSLSGMYALLRHMTGSGVATMDLPRAVPLCSKALIERYPDLGRLELFKEGSSAEEILSWVRNQEKRFGVTLEVPKLPEGVYKSEASEITFARIKQEAVRKQLAGEGIQVTQFKPPSLKQ